MRNPFASGVGGVLSADIAVPEHERELGFYAKTLTTGADPLWREDLMNNRGTPVIGLGPRSPEWESLPLQWMPHFQVSDVGASARRALELGGSELLHGRSEEGQSQWAVLVDPRGRRLRPDPRRRRRIGAHGRTGNHRPHRLADTRDAGRSFRTRVLRAGRRMVDRR
jgi:predicted enzyme related to lactoylglutathione lyase